MTRMLSAAPFSLIRSLRDLLFDRLRDLDLLSERRRGDLLGDLDLVLDLRLRLRSLDRLWSRLRERDLLWRVLDFDLERFRDLDRLLFTLRFGDIDRGLGRR